MFGDDCVNFREGKDLSVTVDGVTATIDPETRVSTSVFLKLSQTKDLLANKTTLSDHLTPQISRD